MVVLAVLVAGCSSGGDKPAEDPVDAVRVDFAVVIRDSSCAEATAGGYDDLPDAQVEVFDGGGNLLGFGALDDGKWDGTNCQFTAPFFTVKPSGDGLYRVHAGNDNRGFVNATEDDLLGDRLRVRGELGS